MAKGTTAVPKKFDDLLEALIHQLKEQPLTIPVTLLDQLVLDLADQRNELQTDIELCAKSRSFHKEFMANQSRRFQRYRVAVEMLRAMYRDRPEALIALEVFKQANGKSKKKQPQAA